MTGTVLKKQAGEHNAYSTNSLSITFWEPCVAGHSRESYAKQTFPMKLATARSTNGIFQHFAFEIPHEW